MPRERVRPLVHAQYLSWAMQARWKANERARRDGMPDVLDRWSLHLHLFRWAVDTGRISEPDPLDRPLSYYVSLVFARDRDAVIAEARRYWRARVKGTPV